MSSTSNLASNMNNLNPSPKKCTLFGVKIFPLSGKGISRRTEASPSPLEKMKQLSEGLLNHTRDPNKNSEKIYEINYELRKLAREHCPSKSDHIFQMEDDLFIEQRRKNNYKWFGMK